MELIIDLAKAKTELEVLNIFGRAFGYTEEKFWGKNWDAFNDILAYLDVGGIYGTNDIINNPIKISIRNFHDFKTQAPYEFSILKNILNKQKIKNPNFEFNFIEE